MRRLRPLPIVLATLAAFVALANAAAADPLPEYDASLDARPSPAALARVRAAADDPAIRRLVRVRETDERHGVPSFVWANRRPGPAASASRVGASNAAGDAARAHLAALAPLWRLGRDDVAGAKLARVRDDGRGAVIAAFRQEVDGVPVFRDELKVCMDRNLRLVSVSGALPPRTAAPSDRADAFRLGAERAVESSLRDFAGLAAPPAGIVRTGESEGGYATFAAPAPLRERTDGLAITREPRARRVWFHVGERLEPAHHVEVIGEAAAYAYVWSARDGALLFRHGLVQDAAFSYRVWAGAAYPHVPMDGPQGDGASPHPTGLPDFFQPSLVAPNMVSLQNAPFSLNDPWLADGATETRGNNVDAYADLIAPDGFSAGDLRATTTSPGTFDRTYDTSQGPGWSTDQRMASVTSLFYVNNWLHDMFYDAGFDEIAGNAQQDNFGRGGLGGDRLLAEAQDYGGTNNANMMTPADGASPRMQMYVFNPPSAGNVIVSSPAAIAGTYLAGTAAFGPSTFTLSGVLAAGQDATAPVDDACTAITSSVAGKIAIVDRGTCSFPAKALNAQAAGAIGLIIVNNVAGSTPPALGGSGAVTIPVVSVTQSDGALLRSQLGAGVTLTLRRVAQIQRDGTLDGHIVAHEWGHYISNRLIGDASGLSNTQGGGMGEGWGDFHSLLMVVRPGDGLAGTYSVGGYARSGSNGVETNSYYFGVRRYPYSTDMSRNPLTFRHIANGQALPAGPPLSGDPSGANNAQVHSTGEVWCSMLWECYAALLGDTGRLTFDQARERMIRYLVEGYMLTPSAPTFTEARDAILASALASDPDDFLLMAAAFAKRGMGTGAVSPPRSSTTNVGVTESYGLGGDLTVLGLALSDDLHVCDSDSYLDNGERGQLWVEVANVGVTALSATTITVTSPDPSVTFPHGNVVNLVPTTPFTAELVPVTIELSGAAPRSPLQLVVALDDPGLLVPGPRIASLDDVAHADEALYFTDDAESHHTTWAADGAAGSAGEPWARAAWAAGEHAYHVEDAGGIADLRFVSPPLALSASEPFTMTFLHRWSFEQSDGYNWDGGVIELSSDGGANWTDVGASVTPGYGGTITGISGNPLGARSGWVGSSAGYPAFVFATLDLGLAYAGQTVLVRFRHGADMAMGGPGWWVDNVTANGVVSAPFLGLADELDSCAPLAVGDPAPADVALALAGGHPARGAARLRFALPSSRRVRLTVHDLAGRLVATLADGTYSAGWHDAAFTRSASGEAPGAGVYFARLLVDGRQVTRRIVVVR